MTFNSTLGHTNQNAVGSVAQADAYFADRVESTDWTGATTANKEIALQSAASVLLAEHKIGGVNMFRKIKDSDGLTLLENETAPPFSYNFDQRLPTPKVEYSNGHVTDYYNGTADSGSTTTLVDAAASTVGYPDDFWNYGSILLTARSPVELYAVTDYAQSTGTFTFDTISSAVTSSDTYIAVAPPPSELFEAFFEQALYMLGGKFDHRATLIKQGVVSINSGGVSETYHVGGRSKEGSYISPVAEDKIRHYRPVARFG